MTDADGTPTYRFDYYYHRKSIVINEYSKSNEWIEGIEIFLDEYDENDSELIFGLSKENKLIYRERNKETGFYELVLHERGKSSKKVIASAENQDILSAIIDGRSGEYLGYRTQIDLIENHYTDEYRQNHYKSVAEQIPNSNFSAWASREHGKRVVIKSTSADNPGAYYIYNYETKKVTLIGDAYKKLTPDNLAQPGRATYLTRDGQKIRMYLLFPPGFTKGDKAPLVLLPHGGPQHRDSATFYNLAQYIASLGYLVIQPNFRGSTGYGLKFEEAGYKQWGGLMQDDLTDAVSFAIDKGFADPDKICVVGISYGGYAALMATIKTPKLFSCSVSINGVSDLKSQIVHTIRSARLNSEKIEKYSRKYRTPGYRLSNA
jgi:dipeptidyl aminopeptidase/acylaminoacyl peptidase